MRLYSATLSSFPLFPDSVLLCLFRVVQASLKLTEDGLELFHFSVSISPGLRLQACATISNFQ